MIVRPACEEDYETIKQILLTSTQYQTIGNYMYNPEELDDQHPKIKQTLQKEEDIFDGKWHSKSLNFNVLEDNDIIVGFIGFKKHYINYLYIDMSFQGKGYGNTLLNESKLRKPVFLFSSDFAYDFYRKYGFIPIEKKTKYFPRLMVKLL